MTIDEIRNIVYQISENDDEKAFKELFRHFSPRLVAYSKSIVHDTTLAEEVVEDVFINIWKNRKMLHTIKSIPYYLFASARNTAINYISRDKTRNFLSIDEIDETFIRTVATPETGFIEKDNAALMLEAVKSLPPKCQAIFRMAKEEGLTYKEIARLLDISPKTVEAQMNTAFKKLLDALKISVKNRKKGAV